MSDILEEELIAELWHHSERCAINFGACICSCGQTKVIASHRALRKKLEEAEKDRDKWDRQVMEAMGILIPLGGPAGNTLCELTEKAIQKIGSLRIDLERTHRNWDSDREELEVELRSRPPALPSTTTTEEMREIMMEIGHCNEIISEDGMCNCARTIKGKLDSLRAERDLLTERFAEALETVRKLREKIEQMEDDFHEESRAIEQGRD